MTNLEQDTSSSNNDLLDIPDNKLHKAIVLSVQAEIERKEKLGLPIARFDRQTGKVYMEQINVI
ncbi:MAG: hypothetical protein IJ661_03865 [Lachnospiraceae bacterium]|nr:hypothetical protein [Lachnospiraceae bacterium]